MSDTPAFSLTHKHNRCIRILSGLIAANAEGRYPTVTELAHAGDDRTNIPRPTISSRRTTINAMINAGLIELHHVGCKGRNHYAVSLAGITELRLHMLGVKP